MCLRSLHFQYDNPTLDAGLTCHNTDGPLKFKAWPKDIRADDRASRITWVS
jgi:hypothetical protein